MSAVFGVIAILMLRGWYLFNAALIDSLKEMSENYKILVMSMNDAKLEFVRSGEKFDALRRHVDRLDEKVDGYFEINKKR